ncbi:hypothetical protein HK096_010646, partial [Nowakowskiella sp. JEL0078]
MVESDDESERMERLLELNDLINTVVKKYSDFKSGRPLDTSSMTSSKQRSIRVQSTQPVSKTQKTTIASLIDLDDIFSVPAENSELGSISLPAGNSNMNDLESLFGGVSQSAPINNLQLNPTATL